VSHPAPTSRALVRREVAGRQLAAHLARPPARVLDVGSGVDALRLARAGHDVLVVEPDEPRRRALLRSREAELSDVRSRVRVEDGAPGRLPAVVDGSRFDVIACHVPPLLGDSPREAVVELCDLVSPGGIVSLVVRNADSMALRPAAEQRWADALDVLASAEDPEPRCLDGSAHGARPHRLEELASYVAGRRMHLEAWYGVGLLTDLGPSDQLAKLDVDELDTVLAAEELAGRTDPYRRVAPLLHVVGRRA
jgi:S-adenosylmethionine-dependent methyltransferase